MSLVCRVCGFAAEVQVLEKGQKVAGWHGPEGGAPCSGSQAPVVAQ